MHDIHARTSGGYRVDAHAGDRVTIMDEPASAGGTDAGPTPMETLLASLAGCTAVTLKMYSGRKGWPLEDVEVRVHLEPSSPAAKDTPPKITQTVTLKGDLDEEQRERLLQIAGRCPVHRLMEGPVAFEEVLSE
jgi:putative redox protein